MVIKLDLRKVFKGRPGMLERSVCDSQPCFNYVVGHFTSVELFVLRIEEVTVFYVIHSFIHIRLMYKLT